MNPAEGLATPADDAWSPWHPQELAARLAGVGRPWCVVGGWALDLWHGHQTRPHGDLEFTVLRDDVAVFRHRLAGMRFYAVGSGIVTPLRPDEAPPASIAQIWCEDVAQKCWRVDMMIEPGTPETWVYKRDPSIARPRGDMVGLTAEGIPYLNPAAILLFKAKYRRDKDEADFERAAPKLAAADSVWLRNSLEALHPGHSWIGRL